MKGYRMMMVGVLYWGALQSAGAIEATNCPVSDKTFLHQITSCAGWTDVHAVFKHNFPACQDDGLYADGYTNLVVGTLAMQWDEIDRLNELTTQDDAFKQFVMRHIGISAGEADLKKVLQHAQTGCTKKSARLCKEIALHCKDALKGKK